MLHDAINICFNLLDPRRKIFIDIVVVTCLSSKISLISILITNFTSIVKLALRFMFYAMVVVDVERYDAVSLV
jgi:hypothetical protein